MWKSVFESQVEWQQPHLPVQLANFRDSTRLFVLCKHIGKVSSVVWTARQGNQTLQTDDALASDIKQYTNIWGK